MIHYIREIAKPIAPPSKELQSALNQIHERKGIPDYDSSSLQTPATRKNEAIASIDWVFL